MARLAVGASISPAQEGAGVQGDSRWAVLDSNQRPWD